MEIETIAVVGFVFAAVSLGRIVYERRMDVLHGPYIEGRTARPAARSIWKPALAFVLRWVFPLADRLRWKLRNMIYLASVVPC